MTTKNILQNSINFVDKFFAIDSKKYNYSKISFLFRILLGFIYLTLFITYLLQIPGIMGSDGILPVTKYIEERDLNYLKFPTIYLFFNDDPSIIIFILLGIIFSILLILGYMPKISLLFCYLLHLSHAVFGIDFFFYEMDFLLLEASFLALFLPLGGKLFYPKILQEPSPLIVFLFRWLVFRLYFESGLAKIHGNWLSLNVMSWYYETTSLPSWPGWFMQQLSPDWLHVVAGILALFIQIFIPLFIFYSRNSRIIAFFIFLGLEGFIAISGNYGYLNLLAIIIALFLLDDHFIMGFEKVKKYFSKTKSIKGSNMIAYISIFLVLFIVPFSIFEFTSYFKGPLTNNVAFVQEFYRPFGIINQYHIFDYAKPEGLVTEIYGSNDGKNWKQFKFKYTPQDTTTRPPFLFTYFARFHQQFSYDDVSNRFYTATDYKMQLPYFRGVIRKICTEPEEIKGLLREVPFEQAPKFIKIEFYKYTFSEPKQLFNEGKWWNREFREYSGEIECKDFLREK